MFQKTFNRRKITNSELIKHLNAKGKQLILKLYKLFSFTKPKRYSLFKQSKISENNYEEEDKLIMSLISIIKKYNKLIDTKELLFHDLQEENEEFSSVYKKFRNNYNKNFNNNNQLQYIVGPYLPKYANKGIIFKNKFLQSNIFKTSGLLATTPKQVMDYVNHDIKLNGVNSYNSIKIVYFIEKLYKQIDEHLNANFIGRRRLNDEKFKELMNAEDKNKNKNKKKLKKSDTELEIIHLNEYLKENNEIKFNEQEIEKLKNLIEIAEKEYIEFYDIGRDSGYTSKNNSSILKSNNNSMSKIKNYELKKMRSNKKLFRQQSLEKSLSIFDKSGSTLTTKYPKDNESFFFSPINNFKKKIEFNEVTPRKSTLRNKSRNDSNLNNQKNLSSNEENSELKDGHLPKSRKSSNADTFNDFNKSHNVSKINNNKRINFILNSFDKNEKSTDDFNKKRRSKRGTTLKINRYNNQKLKFYIGEEKLPKGKFKKSYKKIREPPDIPKIYEELKDCKNIFSFSHENFANKDMQKKAKNLFLQMYDQEKIDEYNQKNSPIDLYRSFYKIKYRIERQESDYKKLYRNFSESIKHKLNETAYQDEELKNRYREFVQIMIRRNLMEDNK